MLSERMKKNILLKVLSFILTGPIGLIVWFCIDFGLACADCKKELDIIYSGLDDDVDW